MIENLSRLTRLALRRIYMRAWRYRVTPRRHAARVGQVSREGRARVVFLAMSVAMWRYQHLWELLDSDPRFDVNIVISPAKDYAIRQQQADVEALRRYFGERQMPYIDFDVHGQPFDFGVRIDPDIVFYPQPYEGLLVPLHDCTAHYDRLVAYYPYSFMTGAGKQSFDFHFHNLAWRLYYSTDDIAREARLTAWNRGRNVRVVGYPNADDFMGSHRDVWRPMSDGRRRLRLIWAPHHSVVPQFGLVPRGNFLWMAEPMLELARRYSDRLQIAFKPHPRLRSVLYDLPEWGPRRTDDYYRRWAEGDNTQLELEGYVDLFMTGDAMVHDSCSFNIEYHYSLKPVMFVARDLPAVMATQTGYAREAIEAQYIGASMDDVTRFIDDVALGGNDPMLPRRREFHDRHLLPPNGQSVARNTLDDLLTSLHFTSPL